MFEKNKVMQAFEKEFEHYKKKNINLYGLINKVDEFMDRLHEFEDKLYRAIR